MSRRAAGRLATGVRVALALRTTAALCTTVALLAACGSGDPELVEARAVPGDWTWSLPPGFPVPKVPDDNPMSVAKVELGRYMFHDRRLSGNGTQSCADCHRQSRAFTDGRAQAVGSTGEVHPRGAQSLANVVYNATLTWANPSLVTLERQMETPLFGESPVEMGITDATAPVVLARLRADASVADYPTRFAAAFPEALEPLTWASVIRAIASFQRSLISGDSRYDRWLQGRAALSDAEQRGRQLFFGERAKCSHCHGSFNFNDQIVDAASRVVETPFHNTGLYNLGGTGAFPEPNRGVFELTARAADMGAFRAPSLRNVEVTSPYMHDGSIATLEDVVRFYAAGGRVIASGPLAGDGRANPFRSDVIARIALDAQEQSDLVAFLKALTDHAFLTDPRHADPFAGASR